MGAHSPTSSLKKKEAILAARTVQTNANGRKLGYGSGDSMAPIYKDNTILVIHPVKFDELKPGMIIAYWNTAGKRVVHELLKLEGTNWIAKGLNNETEDSDWVTPENLIGAVYATFQSER